MSSLSDKQAVLAKLNIPVWVRADTPVQTQAAAAPAVTPVEPDQSNAEQLASLQQTVSKCEQCVLHQTRIQSVFGAGSEQAKWLLIGEAPGADEDQQGLPFVGRAGKLLTRMLESLGVSREQVYITNTVKCRPPDNRDPQVKEVAACADHLQKQIDLIQPELIIALGRVAAQRLLKTDLPLSKLRGQLHAYEGTSHTIPVMVTYHPAYLLRAPTQKRAALTDWSAAWRQCDPVN